MWLLRAVESANAKRTTRKWDFSMQKPYTHSSYSSLSPPNKRPRSASIVSDRRAASVLARDETPLPIAPVKTPVLSAPQPKPRGKRGGRKAAAHIEPVVNENGEGMIPSGMAKTPIFISHHSCRTSSKTARSWWWPGERRACQEDSKCIHSSCECCSRRSSQPSQWTQWCGWTLCCRGRFTRIPQLTCLCRIPTAPANLMGFARLLGTSRRNISHTDAYTLRRTV